jgi:hypothetical protein
LAWLDLGLSTNLQIFLRGAAAVGGLVIGWFVTGPIVSLLFRAAFRKPTPSSLYYSCKAGGAIAAAYVIFVFLPIGLGGGGLGFGPGGGGPGDGKGSGGGSGKTKTKNGDGPAKGDAKGETIAIELLGGDRYKGDDRFYLIDGKEPAVTLKEVERLFQDNKGGLRVEIILTRDSVGEKHGAVTRLQSLANKYDQLHRLKPEMASDKSKTSQGP